MAAIPPGFPLQGMPKTDHGVQGPFEAWSNPRCEKLESLLIPHSEKLESSLILHPPIRSDWDDDDDDAESEAELESDNCMRPNKPFICTRGSMGVKSFSLSPFGETLKSSCGISTLRSLPTGTCHSLHAGTQSAPDTVHGTNLKWIRGGMVGHGSLGSVFQALDQETGEVVAVKEVQINPNNAADWKFRADLENEIDIVKNLKHPRIVSYIGHDYMDSCLFIYLEYMPGGSLSQVISQFGALDESLMLLYAREILEGLEYLHTHEPPVVHRDIKGANMLVGLDCNVKLADFGCSKRTQETWSLTMKGSVPWMAPEVIRHTGYGRSADIWSFGCVVIEMAVGGSPWGRFDNPMAAMCKIGMSDATPPIPDFLSDACHDFIRQCVQRKADKRPSATQLLMHELVCDLLTDGWG